MSYQPQSSEPSTASAGFMPSSVSLAQKLVYVYVALAAVTALVAFVAHDALIDAYLADKNVSSELREMVRDGAPAYGPIALIFLVLIGGLLLFSAFNFAKRANWARVVCWVFCGFAALGLIMQFIQPSPIWYKLLGIVSGLVAVAIIVLLARAESNTWFSQRPAGAR